MLTAWTVPTLDIKNSWNQGYSIYNNENVHGDLPTLGPTGDRGLVCFKAERLLLHEVIVEMSVGIKHMDISEGDFQAMINTECGKLIEQNQELLQALNSEYQKAVQTVGSDQVGVNLAGIKAEYESKVMGVVQGMARDRVREIQVQFPALRIRPPSMYSRETLMVAGGQASGKGSSVGLLSQKMGEEWGHTVRINTDSYKPLVLNPANYPPEIYSQLAQQEASLIHGKIQSRLNGLQAQYMCPHVLVDQVFLGSDKLDLAIKSGGKSEIIAVSTKVEDAITRSFSRGVATGRYEDTKGILNCHKRSTAQMISTLANYDGQDVNFTLVDNNVPKGDAPIRTLSVDLKNKTVVIHNAGRLREYLKKMNINIDATGEDDLYENAPLSLKDYLGPLISKGYNITLGESEIEYMNQKTTLLCLDNIGDLCRLEDIGFSRVDLEYMEDDKLSMLLEHARGVEVLAKVAGFDRFSIKGMDPRKLSTLITHPEGVDVLVKVAGFNKFAIENVNPRSLIALLENPEGTAVLAKVAGFDKFAIEHLDAKRLETLVTNPEGTNTLVKVAGFNKFAIEHLGIDRLNVLVKNPAGVDALVKKVGLNKFAIEHFDIQKLTLLVQNPDGINALVTAGFNKLDIESMDQSRLEQLLDKPAELATLNELGFSKFDLETLDSDVVEQLLDNADIVREMVTTDSVRPMTLKIQSAESLGDLIQLKKQSMERELPRNEQENAPVLNRDLKL
jgi:Zeta toxin